MKIFLGKAKRKLLITNLVYGPVYTNIFLNYHIKSLLDPTNIPAHKDRIEYLVFTDPETLSYMEQHPAWSALKSWVKVDVQELDWAHNKITTPAQRYDARYSGLVAILQQSIERGLTSPDEPYLMTIVADLVFAKNFFDLVFDKLDAGYDSVMMQPLRSALEGKTMKPALDAEIGAMPAEQLFRFGYANMHPLWVACHWNASQFTRIPDALLWNTGTGILGRLFSITPIVFTAYKEMMGMNQVIDIGVPPLCRKPYICNDWDEAPVIGVEPLVAWYPPFANHTASVEMIKAKIKSPWRRAMGKERMYYPNAQVVNASRELLRESDDIIAELNE